MSSVAIIGDIDTVSGFRLGGVKKAEVVTTAESSDDFELPDEEIPDFLDGESGVVSVSGDEE